MNENKKMMIMVVIIIAIVALIPITAIVTSIKSGKILEEVNEYIKDEDYKVVYIGRDDCYYCNLFAPEIELLEEQVDLEYLYVNTNNLKSSDLSKLLENLEIDEKDFGTPYLVITKDSKIVAQKSGYMSEDVLFNYLKEQKVIEEDVTLSLNYIDYTEYTNLINSNQKQIVVIGQSGCSACTSAKPNLYEVANEYDVKINYLNAAMLGEENSASFQTSLAYYEENGISTPTMLIVSNKEVIDSLVGSAEADTYVEFLTENGFIEE